MAEQQARSYDPEFEERVVKDMKGAVDPGLRDPAMLTKWRRMLTHIISDSQIQFSQRKSEMAIIENRYAASGSDDELAQLLAERERYSHWQRGALSFRRAAEKRLAEVNGLLEQRKKK